jgi:hypothetical protein
VSLAVTCEAFPAEVASLAAAAEEPQALVATLLPLLLAILTHDQLALHMKEGRKREISVSRYGTYTARK